MVDYSGSYATPRADLGVAFMEFVQDPAAWVTPRIFPRLDVSLKTATFSAWTRAGILRTDNVKRSPRGKYNRITSDAADHTYSTEHYGLEYPIDDTERARFASDFDAELQATRTLDFRVKVAQELRLSALLFSTATFTGATFTDNSVADPWTDESAAIFDQITDEKERVRKRIGMEPNKLVVSKPVFNMMKKNTDLSKSRRNVTVRLSDREITDSLTETLGLEEIVVAKNVYNSAAEAKTESITDVWSSKYALLGYVARDGAPLEEPSIGRSIYWDLIAEELITIYREEKIRSDVVRCEQFCQEFLYGKEYGQLIQVQP